MVIKVATVRDERTVSSAKATIGMPARSNSSRRLFMLMFQIFGMPGPPCGQPASGVGTIRLRPFS